MRHISLLSVFALLAVNTYAQKSIKEYVDKTGKEKIKKSVIIEQAPQTAGSFEDGHGRTPLLTSKSQLPDTIALITFYVQDIGSSKVEQYGSYVYTTKYNVSGKEGNYYANEILKKSIQTLKDKFKQQGVVLLTPDEFLNTKEKRDFYFNEFEPKVSNVGNFVSNIEGKKVDIVAGASGFQLFDVAAAWDHLRAESLGGELAKKLGVKGVLSIGFELQAVGEKVVNLQNIKMAINGPNPVAKEDKKYVGQKLGTGYYEGNVYSFSRWTAKSPIPVAKFKKKQLESFEVESIDVILETMVEKMYDSMHESIVKAAKKYKK